MDLQNLELEILEVGQNPPTGIKPPPRKPKWDDTLAYIADPERFCRENFQKYGPIFQTSIFGGTTILVGSAKANQMVFNGDLKYTEIALPATTMEMFGEYSLFQRPDLHRQRKTALRPGLTGSMLKRYLPEIDRTVCNGIKNWQNQSKIALYPEVEAICFDILVPILLGINFDNGDLEGLPISSKSELKQLYGTFFDGFYGLIKWKSPLTAYGRGIAARAKLIELMQGVINKRRQQEEKIDPTKDFLGMMLASLQENPEGVFSDRLIENQCLLQLWASLYQIAGLVCSVIYQLGRYPQYIETLRKEQTANKNNLSLEILKEMIFLEAVIKETLRTLPPSSTANRKLTKSVILEGILYQKDWVIIAEPRIAHNLPEHFQTPEKFNPNRFLPNSKEGKMYEFIPFGGGVHACLGAQIAMTITKIFIARFLNAFDWNLNGEAKFVNFPLKKIKQEYQISIASRC